MADSNELPFVQSKTGDEDTSSTEDEFFEQPSKICEQPVLKCSKCKQDLPLTSFYETTNFWHEKRGRTYICKVCSRESAKLYAAKKRLKKVKDETVLSG
jgi:hypothetical protein